MCKYLIVLVTLVLFYVQYDLWFLESYDISTIFVSLFILLIQVTGSLYAYKSFVGFDKFEGLFLKRKKGL